MASWIIVLAASIVAVGLLVGGLALTLIFKGHPIQSEISTNPHMQRLGIKCAVQEAREEAGAACDPASEHAGEGLSGCAGNCSSCDITH